MEIQQSKLVDALKRLECVGNGMVLDGHALVEHSVGAAGTTTAILTATDLVTTIRCVVVSSSNANNAKAQEAYLLPHKEWAVVAAKDKSSKDGPVLFSGGDDPFGCRIVTPELTAQLAGGNPTDWPTLFPSNTAWGDSITVDREDLLEEVEWVARAASVDTGRPHIACLHSKDGSLASTDGHRLHVSTRLDLPACDIAQSSTIALIKLIKRSKAESITVEVGRSWGQNKATSWVRFASVLEGWSATCKTLDVRFPPYEKIVPDIDQCACTVAVDLPKLASAVQRLSKLGGKESSIVFRPKPRKLELSLQASGTSRMFLEIECQTTGALDMIAINGRYVLDAIGKQLGVAHLRMTGSTSAARVDLACGHKLSVLMPVRPQN